jgi:dTDP-4-dehydrorhamnose reductase
MSTVLITGGSSYLGQHLVPLASTHYETFYTYYQNDPLHLPGSFQLDVRDAAAVSNLVSNLNPDVIIHTAGSNRTADMWNVIIEGTNHIAQAAERTGARLIHISSDVIFNGREAPYDESAPPTPIHQYGRAKAEAEKFAGAYNNHTLIRTSLIYGLHLMDRGTAWMVHALRAGQPVTLFTDQRRNPVWVQTLSNACLELATTTFCGIINVAGQQEISRAEFGLRMLDWWQIEERDTLTLGQSDADRWPADCTFDLSRAESLLTTPLPGVDEVLYEQGNFKLTGVDGSLAKKL